jgi:putative transposase
MQLTVKLRLRDKHAAELNRQARAVNFVWNYCNEAQKHFAQWDYRIAKRSQLWLSYGSLAALTAGVAQELGLHSHTVQRVCREYEKARKQHERRWLRFRGRKSLGWVPFNTGHVSFDGEAFTFRGERYTAMHLRDILKPGIKIGAGSFNQDACGRWYINCPVEVECFNQAPNTRVGIDLGLEKVIALSDGTKIAAPRLYRASEARLATLQRAKKTPKRVRRIHAKTANRRKDWQHKVTSKITKQYGLIVVGDVSPSKLAKTRFAKSVLDAGWAGLKQMFSYKSIRNGGGTLEVNEAWTSQVTSCCGVMPDERPRGIRGLGIREIVCDCGNVLDRDVNAARNILRLGLETLAGGTNG